MKFDGFDVEYPPLTPGGGESGRNGNSNSVWTLTYSYNWKRLYLIMLTMFLKYGT